MLRLRLVLCLSLILGSQLGFAQLKQVGNYSFLNIESNRIAYYGNSSLQFERIYKKFSPMIKLGKGQVRILHIGDSHLQADFFSRFAADRPTGDYPSDLANARPPPFRQGRLSGGRLPSLRLKLRIPHTR